MAVYDLNTPNYQNFFRVQEGSGTKYFHGVYQRGYGNYYGGGVADIFSSLMTKIKPVLDEFGPKIKKFTKKIGKELGKEGIQSGIRVLNSVNSGNKLGAALKDEASTGLKNFIRNRAQKIIDKKPLVGSGRKKRRKRSKKHNAIRKLIGRRFSRRKSDVFGAI